MVSRRQFLKGIAGGLGFAAAARAIGRMPKALAATAHGGHPPGHPMGISVPSQVPGGTTAMEFLTHFDGGHVSTLPSGQTLREWSLTSTARELLVARGVKFPGWVYNGYAPGPTLRATEGDRVRVRFANGDVHPHTIHFHGIHPAGMDGVFEDIAAGGSFTYEFDADPFGLFLYHCHTMPLKKHIHKGLYGAFIVDPAEARPPAKEMVMVMNGFDVDFDGGNEFYTVNGIGFYYMDHPIPLRVGELARIYLVNMTEFDPINSFHLHGNVFKLYRTGTRLDQYEITDTVMLCQGERAILEFQYDTPGRYLFHAHQSEFAELGWTGIFDVTP
ncbi:MAG: multicopper oxidase domain-containing protein [Methanobacteriota archaeon]